MAYGNQPLDGSNIPMSSAVPDGATQPYAVAGGPSYADSGNTKVPVSVYMKDGNNVTQGVTTDAAVTSDANGTVSGKLRGLVKIFADMWDSGNHRLNVAVQNANANGQTTMSASSPVAIASDQTAVKTRGDYIESSGLSAGSLNADLVASTDVSLYKMFSVQVTGTWSGTLTAQASNDNSNWFSVEVFRVDSAGTYNPNITSNDIYYAPLNFRYLRVRMTSYSSGTANGVLELYTQSALGILNTIQANISQVGGVSTQMAGSDGVTASNVPEHALGLYNGSTLDQQRGNLDNITILASAAHTTTQTSSDQTNYNARGVIVTFDVTTNASGSVTLEIDYKDPVSGKYKALLTGTAVASSTSTTQYTVYPGVTAAANAAVSMCLPRTWRVVVTANNANSATYSVGASYII